MAIFSGTWPCDRDYPRDPGVYLKTTWPGGGSAVGTPGTHRQSPSSTKAGIAFGLTMRRYKTELTQADRDQWEFDGMGNNWGCVHSYPRPLHGQRHWPQTVHPPLYVGGVHDPQQSDIYLLPGIAPITTTYDAATNTVTFTYDYFPVAGADAETGIEMHEFPPRQDAHASDAYHPHLIASETPLPTPGTGKQLMGELRWHLPAPYNPCILLRWWRKTMYVNYHPWGPP